MKRIPKINKLLAVILALVLFTSSSVGVFAEDEGNIASMENLDEKTSQDSGDSIGETNDTVLNQDSSNPTEQPGSETVEGGEQKINGETSSVDNPSETSQDTPKDDDASQGGAETPSQEGDTQEPSTPEPATGSAEEEGENTEEQIKYSYESNNDGTHIKVKLNEAGEPEGDGETEECKLDKEGKCALCGYEKKIEEPELEDKKLEVSVGDYTVIAEFTSDTFEASDVELVAELEEINSDNLKASYKVESFNEIKAFDISFKSGDGKVQPKDGYKVKITIKSLGFTPNLVVHMMGENNFEQITEFTTDDGVGFSASSFSTYVFADVDFEEDEVEKDSILYENCAYGKAYTDEKHLEGTYDVNSGYKNGRYAVRLYNYNTGNGYATIAPSDDKVFVYSAKNDNSFKFHFEAPENYYIAAVRVGDVATQTIKRSYKPAEDAYLTSYDVDVELDRMGADKYVNGIVVSIVPIPVKWEGQGEKSTVYGATFVNYKNYNHVFGDMFWFNGGHDGGSNECNFVQVYQGLASNTFDLENDGFKLATDNGVRLFPKAEDYNNNKDKYKYVTDYRSNAGVEFTKDTDGYWTFDSSQYKYKLDKESVLRPTEGNQFRPFGEDDHFAMELPIEFSINSDGQSNGKDTIFKFAGDDDVFVYIDGKLVLDLGGIHDIIRGQINFKTGEVLIQGDFASKLTSSVDDTCYAAKNLGNTNIYSILGTNLEAFSKDEHQLTVVYFERGAYLSNCRISYNFNKDTAVEVEYEGLKVSENEQNKIAGAEFSLYEDKECKQPLMDGSGNPLKAVSDSNGTIKFKGISVGVITSSTTEILKTLYMKETKAAEGYQTPANAVWKLDIKATVNSSTSTLTAETAEAKELSLFEKDADKTSPVKAVKNKEAKPVSGDYTGTKLDSNQKALAGATFTIYSDKACENALKDANEKVITATSDKNGKFQFKDLKIGAFEKSDEESISKDYYIKETEAPKGYKLPIDARWNLKLTATKDGKTTSELIAISDEARNLSVVASDKVTAIKNEKLKPGSLKIVKTLLTARKALGTASFVFEVSYTEDGVDYSNVYSYDFAEADTKDSLIINNLPADIDVTVKEIYSGASYELKSVTTDDGAVENNIAKVNIKENETATVKFVNDYNGKNNVGGISIVNVFEKIKDAAGYIFKEKKGGAQ